MLLTQALFYVSDADIRATGFSLTCVQLNVSSIPPLKGGLVFRLIGFVQVITEHQCIA
jgi:hypothetical protein